jgi:hypothetical protein
MGGGSGGSGSGGRSGGGGGSTNGDAGQPGEVVRQANNAMMNEMKYDQKAVTTAIKEGRLSRDELGLQIDITKSKIDSTRSRLDSMLANRGNKKAGDVRNSAEFKSLALKRDTMKSNLGKMYDTMKATEKKEKGMSLDSMRAYDRAGKRF